ncbi:MAG: rhomboid family intramembrane serine protease [Fimbriimonadaceae bacterium]|nr:rhomboid family intramembrane serine protease [Fimbriimonadaceae bacterium]
MLPVRDNLKATDTPIVTYTVLGLLVFIYVWDRGLNLFGNSIAFADLAMRPGEIWNVLRGGGDVSDLRKLFTSMFMHANLPHIIANGFFLAVFGPNVESAIGGWRFALYYLFWGVAASAAQIMSDPNSVNPVLGASGAIGGVLGAYFLLFPGSRIRVIVPPFFFWPFTLVTWVLLGAWFLTQLLLPQDGVATWAHAGGFVAGMLTIQVMGGRLAVLKDRRFEEDKEFDDE